ncbi:cytochrome C oxidase subunit IV family protein [Rhabdothermincola sediminis]|uniref:cytochrome C oxidase subunit IV family protein n=1 Tax=Rhabdothermincola sediminis TaxID=2751370 RepID=UPI001AA021D5|nr:cytochrome C oxidase subunit IV family protein [Rhabdothermincola sediminis]
MAAVTPEPTDQPIPTQALDGAVAEYPRDRLYVMTAVFLAIVTAVEIATYVWPELPVWSWGHESNVGIIAALMVLMAIKFFTVAWVFMHLKFDKPLLNRLFAAGLILAISVYLAVMAAFRMFWAGDEMVRRG